jgi:hypothetical protein
VVEIADDVIQVKDAAVDIANDVTEVLTILEIMCLM